MKTDYTLLSDDQLVMAYFQNENTQALAALVKRHERKLFQICNTHTHDVEESQDLLQESWIKAIGFISKGKYKPQNTFLGWMYSIIYHTYIDVCRKNKTRLETVRYDDIVHLVPSHRTPELIYIDKEFRSFFEEFAKYANTNNPKFEECLRLFFLYQYKYKDIAEETNTPIGTIKCWVFNGRKMAKKDETLLLAV
jgi:RNA polymerase sigma factor (sigma-70 family)